MKIKELPTYDSLEDVATELNSLGNVMAAATYLMGEHGSEPDMMEAVYSVLDMTESRLKLLSDVVMDIYREAKK